jgi:Transglycosylase SLT domain
MRIAGKIALLMLGVMGAAFAADSLPVASTSVPGTIYVATLDNGFNIRFDHRRVTQNTCRLFLTAGEDGFLDVPTAQITNIEQEKLPLAPPFQPAKLDLRSAIAAASDKNDLDADLIDSVIQAESGFNPKAVSPKGAQGLMQLMPGTAAKLGVPDAFDPQANVDGGTRYLRELLARFNNDLAKALAAYNAGPHRVEQYRGVPPYRETRAYVSRIIRDFNRKKLAQMPPQQARTSTPRPPGQKPQPAGE